MREGRTLPVPDYLKDASYPGAERLGRGEGYKYAHAYEGHWVDQDYIPTTRIYYRPTEEGHEKELKARLDAIRQARGITDEAGQRERKANHDGHDEHHVRRRDELAYRRRCPGLPSILFTWCPLVP